MRRSYCRSILLLWYPPPHSLWINLWTCMVSELSCHLWEATIVWTPAFSVYIGVCWPRKSRIYTITSLLLHHRKCLLSICCLPYLPSQGVTLLSANVGRHSLCSRVSLRISIKPTVVVKRTTPWNRSRWVCQPGGKPDILYFVFLHKIYRRRTRRHGHTDLK